MEKFEGAEIYELVFFPQTPVISIQLRLNRPIQGWRSSCSWTVRPTIRPCTEGHYPDFLRLQSKVTVGPTRSKRISWMQRWTYHMAVTGHSAIQTILHTTSMWNLITTVGHRRQVTAVTRLPRWRRRKTRLQVRPLFTMLQGMDRCYFWHANIYRIGLTCGTGLSGHRAPKKHSRALAFFGGWLDQKRRVTDGWEAGDST